MTDLRVEHADIIENFIKNHQSKEYSFMLTIARDGEHPARSIYNFGDAVAAVNAYNRYKDWGFAKEYLTVRLYEPNGRYQEKVLHRPKAGECTFVREDYIKAGNILKSIKNNIEPENYVRLIENFALLFSQDNQRFDEERFFKDTGIIENGENNG